MDARNIEFRLLRYFVTVAEEMHFGRAAARLAMTQPPLSQAIRALEDMLGVALFARTKRSVELTPVGKDLLPEVRRLLAGADALRPLAQSLARGEAGVLSLAFVSTADYGLLPLLLRDFGARYPGVRLQLVEATSDVQVEELVAGRIDAGLAIPPLPPRHAVALSYLPVAREPLVIAMSTDAAARFEQGAEEWSERAVSLHLFANTPLIVFPRRLAPGFYDMIMGCYGAAGLIPQVGAGSHTDANHRQPGVGRNGRRARAEIIAASAADRSGVSSVARVRSGGRNRARLARGGGQSRARRFYRYSAQSRGHRGSADLIPTFPLEHAHSP